jgi:hypothetical protein
MAITGVGSNALLGLGPILDMRNQLDDLQRQLGTGHKSDTYAGLGLDRGLTVGLRSQLNSISGYQSTVNLVGVRLDLMQTALSQFSSVSQTSKGTILQSQYRLAGSTQTQDQKNMVGTLGTLLDSLNTSADGRYLFSGRTVDQIPVESADHILNGVGLKAGLKQIIDERKQADLGTGGLGRLAVSSGGSTVTLDADASPFGFKLVGATTAIAGATVNPPVGSPPTMSVDLPTVPNDGDTVKFTFTLPDGTTRDLTMTATSSTTPGLNQFTAGPATAANLEAALLISIGNLADTELVAASAIQAGNDFFNTDATNPPQRVDGPPFDTATAMIDGTPANTVAWYTGDDATDDPRSTALANADQSLTVSYGARANEQGLRIAVQNLAVFAAVQFSGSDPNGQEQYNALRQRIGSNLTGGPNQQSVADISGQLAGAQVALSNAKDRHDQTNTTLQNLLQAVDGVSNEQVGVQIMALQTSLQATLQTTAMLLQTNILKYL